MSIRTQGHPPGLAWIAGVGVVGFLFTDEAQEIIAESGYRPFKADILKKHRERFPELDLFSVGAVARDWDDAQQRFFAENGIIETVYRPKPR